MPNEMPDMEAYAATLQRVMAEAIAQAEALQAEAVADCEAAFADTERMNDLLREWENQAQREAEDDLPALRKQVEEKIIATVKAKMQNSGKPEAEIARLLQILTTP